MKKLVTNELSLGLDQNLRNNLIDNFKKIQDGVDGQSDALNKQIKDMLGDVTLQGQNEVTQARIDANGKQYQTMKTRLDVDQETAETALEEERATGTEVQKARISSAGSTYPSLKERIDSQETEFTNVMNDKLGQISLVPEAYPDLGTLKAKYPSGKAGIFVVTDTGHKYIWQSGAWTDAGLYNSIGITDRSIASNKVSSIAPYVIRDTYVDDVNIKGWQQVASYSASNHEITFKGYDGNSGILIPVDVPSDVTLDTDLYLTFTYSTSRVDSTPGKVDILLANDDGSFFNKTTRLAQIIQTKTPIKISVKVNLNDLGYKDIPSHYNLLVSNSSDYSVTIKDLYYNQSGTSQPFTKDIQNMDSANFKNGERNITKDYKLWGDSATVATILEDNTLLVQEKYNSNTSNDENWGVRFPLNWDLKNDLYVTIDADFGDLSGDGNSPFSAYLFNTLNGSLVKLSVDEFMTANGFGHYVLKKEKLSSLNVNEKNTDLLISHHLDGWINIKSLSISVKQGFVNDTDTINKMLDDNNFLNSYVLGQNPELLKNASNKAIGGLDLATPANAPQLTANAYLKEVKIFSPIATTVDLRIGTIDQNSLFVNNTRSITNIPVKAGINILRYDRSKIIISSGQRLFINLKTVGMYEQSAEVPSFAKSLIRDTTHYIDNGSYNGYQLYQVDDICPFSYKVVETSMREKVEDIANEVQEISDGVQDILPLKNNLYVKSPSGKKFILMVDNDGNLTTRSNVPTNVVVAGNSLTYNWGNFGLASSDPDHDWYSYVKKYVTKVNSAATFNRLNFSSWESATNTEQRDSIFNEKMKPLLSIDTDLVIIQLGDNVKYEENVAFLADAQKLIQNIKSVSPKTVVMWVASWYSSGNLLTDIQKACESEGAIYVPIHSIAQEGSHTSYVGATQTDADGNTRTIESGGQASHPGDSGHKLIGEAVIRSFDF